MDENKMDELGDVLLNGSEIDKDIATFIIKKYVAQSLGLCIAEDICQYAIQCLKHHKKRINELEKQMEE